MTSVEYIVAALDGASDERGAVLRRGAAGVGASLAGYVVVALVVGPSSVLSAGLGAASRRWRAAGLLFFDAHGVSGVGMDVVSFASPGGAAVLLVPPLVLGATGWLLAGDRDAPRDGARAGLWVVPGYLVALLAGAAVLAPGTGVVPVRPEALPSVVVAGVAWPAVFGAGGGAAAALNRDRDVVEEDVLAAAAWSVAVGAAAFVVGTGLLAAVVTVLYSGALGAPPGWVDFVTSVLDVQPSPGTVAGWAFYNAHGVPLQTPTAVDADPVGGVGVTWATANLVARGSAAVLVAYPLVVLGVAGAAATWNATSLHDAVFRAGGVAAGYAVLFVVRMSSYDQVVLVDLTAETIQVTIHLLGGTGAYIVAVGYPFGVATAGAVAWVRLGPDLPRLGRAPAG